MEWYEYPLPNRTKTHFEKEFRAALNANLANSQTLEAQVNAYEDAIIAASRSYDYVWADDAARIAQGGMVTNEVGFQQDTLDVYKYNGATWDFWYNVLDANGILKYLLPSENEFESQAAAMRATLDGSGFMEMGKHFNPTSTIPNINEGICAFTTGNYPDQFVMGRKTSTLGSSRTTFPILNCHGYQFNIDELDVSGDFSGIWSARILMPEASNSSALPDRLDLAGLEVFHEEMTGSGNKNALAPNGLIPYGASTFAGVTLANTGVFTGQDTYSLFGNWQSAGDTTGYFLNWNTASTSDKLAFLLLTTNTYYNSAGNICQCLCRARSIAGLGDTWNNVESNIDDSLEYGVSTNYVWPKGKNTTITSDLSAAPTGIYRGFGHANRKTLFPDGVLSCFYGDNAGSLLTSAAYQGKIFFYPIALIERLNQGTYHPRYNQNGAAQCDTGGSTFTWDESGCTIASTAECFTDAVGKRKAGTGSISSAASGHPLGEYYDRLSERSFKDLRNYTIKPGLSRILEKGEQDILGAIHRGWEGEWKFVESVSGTLDAETYTSTGHGTTKVGLFFNGESLYGTASYGEATWVSPDDLMLVEGDSKYYICVRSVDNGVDTTIYLHPWYGDVRGDFTISNTYKILIAQRQTTKFKAHCRTEIIGDPASTDYPAVDMYAVPNLVDMSDNTKDATTSDSQLPTHRATAATYAGCKDFCLGKKINTYTNIARVLVSDDPVASGYTEFVYQANPASTANKWGFTAATNEIHINFTQSFAGLGYASEADMIAQCHILVQYEADGNMFELASNSAYLKLGEAAAMNTNNITYGAKVISDLLNKISINSTAIIEQQGFKLQKWLKELSGELNTNTNYAPTHDAFDLYTIDTPASKIVFQLIKVNNRAYLQVIFKEMRYTTAAWQDDAQFQIIDNVKTVGDDDSNPVMYGQNVTVLPLPYLIQDKE